MSSLQDKVVVVTGASSGIGEATALTCAAALNVDPRPFLIAVFVGHRVFQIAIFTAMLTLYADVLPSERRTQGLAIFGLGGLIDCYPHAEATHGVTRAALREPMQIRWPPMS